jgi:hypothetical protein
MIGTAPGRLPGRLQGRASGFLLVALLSLLQARPAYTQRTAPPGQFGIGAQVGQPTGITAKYYLKPDIAVDLLGAWGFDRSVFATLHTSYEYAIPESPLGFFLGPGLHAGRLAPRHGPSTRFGLSSLAGLNYFTQRFEIFLQARPNIELFPDSRVHMGGAVGLRYFFR